MKNKIWNIVFKLWTRTYKSWWKTIWKDLEITKYEIIKETPKYFFIQIDRYETFLLDKQDFQHLSNKDLNRYKKENVEIKWIETVDDLFKKLDKTVKDLLSSDDITENDKKNYKKIHNIYKENRNKF